MSAFPRRRRRFLAPEVVQTSAMDCGPATLKCLLEGFGIPVSYGRLREACQTDVDGTSIDTMEELVGQLGLEAEQIMMPVDHLLLDEAQALPAVVVVRMPNGLTHFVVLWRRHGPLVQVMDPGTGRRWVSGKQFLEEVYSHTFPLSASYWREWAGSNNFLAPLRRRLANLKFSKTAVTRVVDRALADSGWRSLGILDAAVRMIDAIVRSGGLRVGKAAESVLESFVEECRTQTSGEDPIIPDAYWSVQAGPPGSTGEEQVVVRGAVLIRVVGRKGDRLPVTSVEDGSDGPRPLSPELVAALEERPSRPGRELLRLLRVDGLFTPLALSAALAAAAGAVVLEALLFRGLMDLGRELHLTGQRLGAITAMILFALTLLFLEFPIASMLLRIGRRLEIRLRILFLEKIPRLVDRYFQSRLTSDMAERSHLIHTLRLLPELAGGFMRSNFELLFTTAGIIWLDPASAPIAMLAALVAVGLPLLANPVVTEQDLRLRTHVGALSRFYLDALLGLVAVRAHGAERAIRSEHESLLVEWSRAGLALQRTVVRIEGLQAFLGFGLAAWLVLAHMGRGAEPGGVLLLVYWALNLPVIGQEIALLVRQYPAHRNVTLRIMEPLGAADAESCDPGILPVSSRRLPAGQAVGHPARRDVGPIGQDARRVQGLEAPCDAPAGSTVSPPEAAAGVAIALEQVSVRAGGHTILEDIDLTIVPGTHVAVVGASGAGKSSLAGLLLGWHRPAAGRVLIDGQPLDIRRLELLRKETAWVDPAVQLWNRSFLENLRYGAPADGAPPIGWVIEQAHLLKLLESMPDGMQTPLGEGGGLVSGGEGQRIRFGRAMLRSSARLVILDEPFRGLDRERRSQLLAKARKAWSGATLLCITHDVGETQAFERVLVIDGGRIVEDGAPDDLLRNPASPYKALRESENAVRQTLWANELWRRQWLEGGKLIESSPRDTGILPVGGRRLPAGQAAGHPARRDVGPIGQDARRVQGLEPERSGDSRRQPPCDAPAGSTVSPSHDIARVSWPIERLGEAMILLAREKGFPLTSADIPSPPGGIESPEILDQWIDAVAARLGFEAEPIETPYSEFDGVLRGSGPALIRLPGKTGARFLALISGSAKSVFVMGPDATVHRVPLQAARAEVCHEHEAPLLAKLNGMMDRARVAPRRRTQTAAAILATQLSAKRISDCWLLRLPPGAKWQSHARQAGLFRRWIVFLVGHAAHDILWVLSWFMIGKGALEGRFDLGWILAWALVLLCTVPLRMLVTWSGGRLAIGGGAILKQRLLFGVLRLEPEEIRHKGVGQLLGSVIESEAVESLALSGGFLGLVATIELLLAAVILGVGAGGWLHALILLAWCGVTFFLAAKYWRQRRQWTGARLGMTNDLVERMVGHRTRLAQELREHWHDGEDQAVEDYANTSAKMDRSAAWLMAMVPRGWLLVGLCGIVPAFVFASGSPATLAVSLGGILLAFRALQKLGTGLGHIAGAAIAWEQVAPLFHAAARREPGGSLGSVVAIQSRAPGSAGQQCFIEAHDLVFRFRDRGEAVLRGCNLRIHTGDRLLLEGPSGGGKSTLASLLTGLRTPESGLLLLDGLDRHSWGGQNWRRRVAAAPQFHENHVLTGTFAFNLLLGRRWPPSEEDLQRAEVLCRELGLEPLLHRMPAGLLQMVGETGWQLSHGEKSRLYIARALLQGAELIILDESFASLDPENMRCALNCVLARAATLVVIAHP